MGLSLGVKKGLRIKVGSAMVAIQKVENHNLITVDVDGKEYVITDQERVEVLPSVFLSCGQKDLRGTATYSRLLFEAPRTIRIERLKD